MKYTKKCPKCGSTDILYSKGYTGAYGSGSNIMYGATVLSAVDVDRYICGNCGYVEHFVRELDIEKLRKSKKVKPLE
jgi:ribosomal protein S27AE